MVDDIVGKKFGRWIVLKFTERKYQRRPYYLCRCECGREKEVNRSFLLNGRSKSCGCLAGDVAKLRCTTHGHTSGGFTKAYRTWQGIKNRCYNANVKAYKYYGGRGITVCERWLHSFENFLADMGEPEPGLSIDRINNDKGYSPENCRWATFSEQMRNRRPFKRARKH